ncbi:MAG: hypothetical protein AAGH68_12195 [Pseudomonadota bacterium]
MTSRAEEATERPAERNTSSHSQAEWKALALETGFYSDLTFEALMDRLERVVLTR